MILYVEASAGLSGDMLLAALRDLGLPARRLRQAFGPLKQLRAGRGPLPIASWIRGVRHCKLESALRRPLLRALRILAQAEGDAHVVAPSQVHLHQLAGRDTLASIVGFAAGLAHFRIRAVHVSPIPLGNVHRDPRGHRRFRPGPATVGLLRGFDVRRRPDRFEWTTPTGALLMAAFASPVPPPPLRILRIGRARGRLRPPGGPAVLQLLLARNA